MNATTKQKDAAEQLEPEAEQLEPAEPEETGDAAEPGEQEPEQLEPEEEPEARSDARCEAETTVGGNLYRCGLNAGHSGEHSFQPVQLADPEAEPEPETPIDREAIVNEQAKKLDRATDSYSKKVVEILGGDLSGFETCPLCEPFYPGLRLPVPLTAETTAALRILLGMPARENFTQDRFSTTCTDCGGLGKVLTGSHVEQYATVTCLACKGKGWVPVGDERRVTHVTAEPEGHREPEAEHEASPDVDPWGRPKGDPDYGRLPGYEG